MASVNAGGRGSRWSWLIAVGLVMTSVVVVEGGGSSPDATATSSGVYRRPLGNEPATLDPARISDIYSRSIAQQIFDGLVQFDQTLAIKPALAEFWKASRDGLTWTFSLRKGVKFHNGRELTAEDVVYSYTRILDPRTKSGAAELFDGIVGAKEFRDGRAAHVAGLTALDRHTVQVRLTEAQAPFVAVLAVGHAKIVPRDVVREMGAAFGAQPVGTGPFRVVRWDRGREIVLARNDEYFEALPRLSRIVYRLFPGENFDAMYDEFMRGNLEDTPIPSQDYRNAIAMEKYTYVKRPMLSIRFYGFNTRIPPLNDRRVRQALIYAIDRQALIDEVFLGRYVLERGILPPGTQGFNPKLRGYPYDPGKARQLLAQAGFPDGRGFPPLDVWSSVKLERVVREHEHIGRYLKAVGVPVRFHYLTDWPQFTRRLAERAFPVFLYAWFADIPDPENFLTRLFFSRSPRNFFGYVNPTVDDMLLRAQREPDLLLRADLHRRAEETILEDAPLIPVWHYTYERLFQPYVRSIEVNGLGDPYIPLRKIWLDRPRATP